MPAGKETRDRNHPATDPEATGLLRDMKRWWILPLVVVFAIVGILLLVSMSGGGHVVQTGL